MIVAMFQFLLTHSLHSLICVMTTWVVLKLLYTAWYSFRNEFHVVGGVSKWIACSDEDLCHESRKFSGILRGIVYKGLSVQRSKRRLDKWKVFWSSRFYSCWLWSWARHSPRNASPSRHGYIGSLSVSVDLSLGIANFYHSEARPRVSWRNSSERNFWVRLESVGWMHREEAKYIKSMKTNAFVPLIDVSMHRSRCLSSIYQTTNVITLSALLTPLFRKLDSYGWHPLSFSHDVMHTLTGNKVVCKAIGWCVEQRCDREADLSSHYLTHRRFDSWSIFQWRLFR